MGNPSEDSWRLHSLGVELHRLLAIRDLTRVDLEPERLANVQNILLGMKEVSELVNPNPPEEPFRAYGAEEYGNYPLVDYRPLEGLRKAPWPVTPKVKFERELRKTEINHLEELTEEMIGAVDSNAVFAYIMWRKLPDEQKRQYATDFRQESDDCLEQLRQKYEALQDPAFIPYLLEILLSVSEDPVTKDQVASRIFGELDHFTEEYKIAQASVNQYSYEDFWDNGKFSLNSMRSKALTKAVAGSLKAPTRPQPKQLLDELSEDEIIALNTHLETANRFTPAQKTVLSDETQTKLEDLLAPWSNWHVMREHAMLSLMPMMTELSSAQAEWLVYATCINDGYCIPFHPTSLMNMVSHGFHNRKWNQKDSWNDDGLHALVSKQIFDCEIANTVAQAMCTFVLDERLAPSPSSDDTAGDRVSVSREFLVRYALEKPDSARLVHSTMAATFEKAIQLSNMKNADDIKKKRLQSLGGRNVDLDFLNRGELAMMVEVVMDCNAQSCISSIHKLYKHCNPNHSVAKYGRQGLMHVYYVMGVGSKLKDSHVKTASRMASLRLQYSSDDKKLRAVGGQDSIAGAVLDAIKEKHQTAAAMKDSGKSAVTVSTKQACACCGKSAGEAGGSLSRCGRCQLIKYCSRNCQRQDWKYHKKRCSSSAA